jgi:hypothetical protein
MRIIVALYILSFSLLQAQSAKREPETGLNKHHELSSRSLSDTQLLAYTKRAKQKLQDMADFLNLLATSKDASEQKEALKQLQSLFWNVPTWAKTVVSAQNYIGKSKILNLQVVQNLTYTGSDYKGLLAYQVGEKIEQMLFTARKNKKKVGLQEVEVWEIFFN